MAVRRQIDSKIHLLIVHHCHHHHHQLHNVIVLHHHIGVNTIEPDHVRRRNQPLLPKIITNNNSNINLGEMDTNKWQNVNQTHHHHHN